MEQFNNDENPYRDKSIEELRFNLSFYKSRLTLLTKELEFFKQLLDSNSFDPKTLNLFEKVTLFKKQIDINLKKTSKLAIVIERQHNEVQLKIECDELSCDDYFVRKNNEIELDVVNFLTQTAKLKSEIMEYLEGLII
ncbi:hypothetical protein LX77_02741 [Gelidibacter algens]|jgi:hypothetical protein|uniref:Uncharacterized protein n=1 Tax=Gelidibacter algens TaxID=49280 RepID=A0A1A7R6X8_9FLAO|nr:hypothetical protein [Gelidibacter algens]OBX27224.1 hypothetical protein A9996_00405 [Gelidibacter algens]RAJ22082.1 hypothetical protein LX77_02741 [Gelidibacter algens]